jgi:DNA adenine methylase
MTSWSISCASSGREDLGLKLVEQLKLTPFARTEFLEAYEPAEDPLERARRLIIRSFMGFGSDGASGTYRTGFRSNSNRSGTTPAQDWANYPEALAFIIDRLSGVVVENKPAMAVMAAHDGEETLHYADPPYLPETRRRSGRRADNGGVYRHELSDGDHAELLEFMKGLEGMVVLSGYPSELYDDTLAGWRRVTKETHADGASDRLEVLWLNPAIARRLEHGPLFGAAA